MSSLAQRVEIVELVDEAVLGGARYEKACGVIGIAASTLRRWRPDKASIQSDGRPTAHRESPANRFTEDERSRIVETCNSGEFASLPPSQIVPILADRGLYIGSESTIYRHLKHEGQLSHRGRAKKRKSKKVARTHVAEAINQVWMMDVTWCMPGIRGEQDAHTGSRVYLEC